MKAKQNYFLKLYNPVHNRFERFCRARVFGCMDYQDLMNESLLIAFQKIDSLKSEQAFLSFLIGISIRVLANSNRKNKEQLIDKETAFEMIDVNAKTERDAEVYLLHKALAMLPENQKECIILFEISGFSIKEIMEIQGSSESAIKQRLKRARAKLLEILSFETEYKKEVSHGTK